MLPVAAADSLCIYNSTEVQATRLGTAMFAAFLLGAVVCAAAQGLKDDASELLLDVRFQSEEDKSLRGEIQKAGQRFTAGGSQAKP